MKKQTFKDNELNNYYNDNPQNKKNVMCQNHIVGISVCFAGADWSSVEPLDQWESSLDHLPRAAVQNKQEL